MRAASDELEPTGGGGEGGGSEGGIVDAGQMKLNHDDVLILGKDPHDTPHPRLCSVVLQELSM